MLNQAPGPLLARWHPELGHCESTRPAEVSPLDHERNWDKAQELRAALEELRRTLVAYGSFWARLAGPSRCRGAGAGSEGIGGRQAHQRLHGFRSNPVGGTESKGAECCPGSRQACSEIATCILGVVVGLVVADGQPKALAKSNSVRDSRRGSAS